MRERFQDYPPLDEGVISLRREWVKISYAVPSPRILVYSELSTSNLVISLDFPADLIYFCRQIEASAL
jgi:hypothetical protein